MSVFGANTQQNPSVPGSYPPPQYPPPPANYPPPQYPPPPGNYPPPLYQAPPASYPPQQFTQDQQQQPGGPPPPPSGCRQAVVEAPNGQQYSVCDPRASRMIPIGPRIFGILHPKVISFPFTRKYAAPAIGGLLLLMTGVILVVLHAAGLFHEEEMQLLLIDPPILDIIGKATLFVGAGLFFLINTAVRIILIKNIHAFQQHYSGSSDLGSSL